MEKKIYGCILILLSVCHLFAQTGTVRGNINLENGDAADFVSVGFQKLGKGGYTNKKGFYEIKNVPVGTHVLTISYVGFKTESVKVSVKSNQVTRVKTVKMKVESGELEEIEVIGSKAERYIEELPSMSLKITTPLIETPQNISVATQQTLRDFGITGTAEMSRLTSGIVKRYGNDNDFAFIIRGTDATNNIFRNGVGSYWWNQQSDAYMIERVEFVKGPSGFMIGNSEPGGLLNEVTKQADGVKVGEVMVGSGSYNLARLGVDIGGELSNRFNARLVAGGQYTETFYDFYESNRTYIVGSIRYKYGNNSYIQAEVNRMDGWFTADNYSNFTEDGSNFYFPESFNAADPNALDGLETDDTYLRLSHEHKLGNGWSIRSQIANVEGQWDGDGVFTASFSSDYDTLYREFWHTNWTNGVRTAQSYLDGKFKTGANIEHSFLGGIDYGDTWIESSWGDEAGDDWGARNAIVVSNPTYNLTREWANNLNEYPGWESSTEWLSAYVQDHIKLYNKLVVTVAGRLSRTKAYNSWDSLTVKDTKFTPRFGLTYLLNDNMSFYGLFDETFLPQTVNGALEGGGSPKPLTGSNLEFGYKAELNKRLAINASLFRTVKNDVLVQNPLNQLYQQRGQIVSKGIEASVIGQLTDNIIANINYTLTDAKITEDADSSMIGFPNYGVARHIFNGMVRYSIPRGVLKNLAFGAGVQYTDDISVVWAGWTDPEDKHKTLPGYAIWDANISYEWNRFTFQGNLYNIFNKRALSSGWWDSWANDGDGLYSGALITPTNFRVNVFYKFF